MTSRNIFHIVACLTWLLVTACGDEPSQLPGAVSSSSGAGGSSVGSAANGGAGLGSAAIGAGAAGSVAGAAGRNPALGAAGSSAASGSPAFPTAGTGVGAAGRGVGTAGTGTGTAGRGTGAAGTSSGNAGAGGSVGGAGGYSPCPAAPAPCKILPFGDSITFGLGFAGGYRVELFSKAVMAGQHITFLGSQMNGPASVAGMTFPKQNEGHSGWKIDQMLPLIPSPALQVVPEIILVMIGTNDIAQNDRVSEAPMRLGALIDKLIGAAPNALIVVAKLTPLSSGSSAIQTYNAALPAVIKQRADAGKHVQLVDMFTGFPTSELADGVHPNQQGCARMAGVWYAAIGGLLH